MGLFYRFTKDRRRKAVDLYDLYGGSVFLCGGHPSLKNEDLSLFSKPGISTLAMNNTATMFRPSFWVCADKPECYSPSVIHDPGILKFARLCHSHRQVGNGLLWNHMPGTLFYSDSESAFKLNNVLHRSNKFAWWKNVFIIAIQLCYRLGFRKIYLCGVGLQIEKDAQYAYPSGLTDGQVNKNKGCYNNVYMQLRDIMPHYNRFGLRFVSCTPDSRSNEFLPYMPLTTAVAETLSNYPKVETINVKHSSEMAQK